MWFCVNISAVVLVVFLLFSPVSRGKSRFTEPALAYCLVLVPSGANEVGGRGIERTNTNGCKCHFFGGGGGEGGVLYFQFSPSVAIVLFPPQVQ